MSRRVGTLVAVLVLGGVLATAATGAKPVREPLPTEDFVIPATVCGFAVLGETLFGGGTALLFEDRMLISGPLKVRLTNTSDPTRTLELNIPGPGVFDEAGFVGTGPWLLYFEPGDLGAGSAPLLVYVKGRFRVDESGYELLGGTELDLCPLLRSP